MEVLEKYCEKYFLTFEVGCLGKGFLSMILRS